MGWSLGHDSRHGKYGRDIGYGVPATCDHPGCGASIDRGLSYVCGTHPFGGDHGCGLHFCGEHLHFEDRDDECPQLCERCAAEAEPFEPTPDVREWVDWKLTDESWAVWRTENPEEVKAMRALGNTEAGAIAGRVPRGAPDGRVGPGNTSNNDT